MSVAAHARLPTCFFLALLLLAGTRAGAQPSLPPPPEGVEVSREGGYEWATVRAANNPAWTGYLVDTAYGRGSVAYDFRIARTELSVGQWLEFVNTIGPLDTDRRFRFIGLTGLREDLSYPGPGYRMEFDPFYPNAADLPLQGLSWRNAARFCNWLHNGRQASLESLEFGAYDTSTFGENPDNSFTDQITHTPGARFWIPTLDEWMKAVYFDPNQAGPGQAGWWEYPNSSNTPLVPGVPGIGQTSAGLDFTDLGFGISLGAYPDQQSPWGLLDASGGISEWVEEPVFGPPFTRRGLLGSSLNIETSLGLDRIGQVGSQQITPISGWPLGVAPRIGHPFTGFWYAAPSRHPLGVWEETPMPRRVKLSLLLSIVVCICIVSASRAQTIIEHRQNQSQSWTSVGSTFLGPSAVCVIDAPAQGEWRIRAASNVDMPQIYFKAASGTVINFALFDSLAEWFTCQ